MAEVLYKIVHDSPEPLSRFCPDIDPSIERAVYKCLERDPERRYQELNALRRDVARIRQRIEAESTDASAGDTLVLQTPTHGGSVGVPAAAAAEAQEIR